MYVNLPVNLQACLSPCLSRLSAHTPVCQPGRDAAIAHYPVTQQFSTGLLLKNTQVVEKRCTTVTLSQWHRLDQKKRQKVTICEMKPLFTSHQSFLLALLLVLMSSTFLSFCSVLLCCSLSCSLLCPTLSCCIPLYCTTFMLTIGLSQ